MKQKPISSAGFSKGTGYGNGSIKTKWNMVDHLEKLRYDDNNIACLLKVIFNQLFYYVYYYLQILRAYILPEKTVKPNLPKTSDLSPQSQCETKPTSSGHRAPKKARLSESDESIENIQSEIDEACSTSTHKTSNNISDENLMQPSMNVDFVKLLYRSCLRNTLHSYIRTDSCKCFTHIIK
jgi:hypothetical protein